MNMLIKPKIRGFICTTAHPVGCAANVWAQIKAVQASPLFQKKHSEDSTPQSGSKARAQGGPKKVLVIGSSTGYGLASRITAAFGHQADTLGIFFEKEPTNDQIGTAGWYNNMALEQAARAAGLYAKSLNGDAFSDALKAQTIDLLKREMGPIDLVIYSLASPRRTHPKTGVIAKSVLKPIQQAFDSKTLDTDKAEVKMIHLEPATEAEIAETVSVMGGEDWEFWIEALADAGLLAPGCKTVSYTYLGAAQTWPIYGKAAIGKAKEDLDRAAAALNVPLKALRGSAHIAVMKAIVTQASSAIPIMPLYISLLYKVMKDKGVHEGAIEQMIRLFGTQLYGNQAPSLDEAGRFRLDDLEVRADVQAAVTQLWHAVETENVQELSDFSGYQADFLKLFGFGLGGVDYEQEVDPQSIAALVAKEF